MKKNENTTINGITLTPGIMDVMESWQPSTPQESSLPEVYIGYLNGVQDFLCLEIANCGTGEDGREQVNQIAYHLSCLIHIKKDLEKFVMKEGGEL